MQNSETILYSKIINENGSLTSKIIVDLIKDYDKERTALKGLWDRYKGDTPIKHRTMPDRYKINNKISHDFRGQIVRQKTGYLFGEPITYSFNHSNYNESQIEQIKSAIKSFNRLNNIEDLDNLTGEYATACGYGARLFYIDTTGLLRAMNIVPWEVIFVKDPTLDKVSFAIIYYQVDYVDIVSGKSEKRWKVEFYDNTKVTIYFEYEKNKFIEDPLELKNPFLHMFNSVPVIKYSNNALEMSDFEKVEPLIDSYDLLVSDAINELEEFRLAYLAVIGGQLQEEDVLRAKQNGTFNIPEGVDVKFITKTLQTDFVENQKKSIRENIYLLSNTVDLTDQAFSGNAESGISRKYRFAALEDRSIETERKFNKAFFEQYQLISFILGKKNIPLKYEDMEFIWKRNLPIDLLYYGQVVQMFTGQVSEKTKLGLLPFVVDVDSELKQMIAENQSFDRTILLEDINVPAQRQLEI